MKKKIGFLILCLGGILSLHFSSLAGRWDHDGIGYWYDNQDGSYKKNEWLQDTDGKWYYFNENGYMLRNATTPDGYRIGPDGAWMMQEDPTGSMIGSWNLDRITDSSGNTDNPQFVWGYEMFRYGVYFCLEEDMTFQYQLGVCCYAKGSYTLDENTIRANCLWVKNGDGLEKSNEQHVWSYDPVSNEIITDVDGYTVYWKR